MSLRIQIALLFLAGGLVLSDAAQASTSGTFSCAGRPHDQVLTEGDVDGHAETQHPAEG